jgi:hypothetical protein
MRFKTRQARLEKKVYESINDLEEEFGLEVDDYPEVHWLGRLGRFEDLGLPETYREPVEDNRSTGGSIYLHRPNIIVINKELPRHVNEESSHCFHLNNARIYLLDKTPQDWYSVNVLIEMFGYLGSKILDPSRKNIYEEYPDYLSVSFQEGLDVKDALGPLKKLDKATLSEFLIHSQGYGLGERMFYALESGELSTERVRNLLRKGFKRKGSATNELINLRGEFWPIG